MEFHNNNNNNEIPKYQLYGVCDQPRGPQCHIIELVNLTLFSNTSLLLFINKLDKWNKLIAKTWNKIENILNPLIYSTPWFKPIDEIKKKKT